MEEEGERNQLLGRFLFNKNSGLKFRKFHVSNGTVHCGCSDPTQATGWLVIVNCKHDPKEWYWGQQFWEMERNISVRPTNISGPPLKLVPNILVRPNEMIRSIWCTNRNFRNFGLNGKRPLFSLNSYQKNQLGQDWPQQSRRDNGRFDVNEKKLVTIFRGKQKRLKGIWNKTDWFVGIHENQK